MLKNKNIFMNQESHLQKLKVEAEIKILPLYSSCFWKGPGVDPIHNNGFRLISYLVNPSDYLTSFSSMAFWWSIK